jgi:hypothetical protein
LPQVCVTLKTTEYSYVRSNIISNVDTKIGSIEAPFSEEFIYPSPALDKLFIRSGYNGNATITIYDIQGKQVLTTQISEQIDISSLSKGIYFVKLTAPAKVIINKMVKE